MEIDILSYDHYIVAFSGGKDSTACLLHLLDLGVPTDKIELWHHLIDGAPNSLPFMDWRCTEDYCRKFAAAFNIPIYYSWLEGGFKQEMLRDETPKAETWFQIPFYGSMNEIVGLSVYKKIQYRYMDNKQCVFVSIGGKGKPGTRLMFPQVSPDLKVRWCSSYLKRDVSEIALANQSRFLGKRTLSITGERGQESPNRLHYIPFKSDRKDLPGKRHIDHWMPIHSWQESDVWGIIERHKIRVHPCYYLGFGRCSCQFCIFGNKDQFATAAYISSMRFETLSDYEESFGVTLKRDKSLKELISSGSVYPATLTNPNLVRHAISKEYTLPIFTTTWRLPAGAYGDTTGPI